MKSEIDTLIDGYVEERRCWGLAISTLSEERRVLKCFARFLGKCGAGDVRLIGRRHLEAWADYLREAYRIPGGPRAGHLLRSTTVYGRVMEVRGFVRHLMRIGRVLADPSSGFTPPRYNRSLRRFIPTVEEVGRFLEAIEGKDMVGIRDRALFELLYSTALRAGEAAGLDLYDLNLADGTVRVRDGKGHKDRVVPVGKVAREQVEHYLERVRPLWWAPSVGEAVFVTKRAMRMSNLGIDAQCRHWRSVARLPFLTPHALRHAAATHMIQAGADVRQVQALLGHDHITTTQIYTHVVIADLIRAHRRSHPRF